MIVIDYPSIWFSCLFLIPVAGIFGIISSVGRAVGNIFGKKKTTSSSKPSFSKQLKEMKASMTKQMNQQAAQSKKTLMFVGIGAGVLMLVMFLFMKK